MIEINFSPADLDEVLRVATLRNKPKMDRGIVSNLFGRHKFDEQTSHFNGVMAEFAVSYLIGAEVDKTSRLSGDKGSPDLIGPDGTTYEVKYTAFPYGDFIVPDKDPAKFVADIGVLCYPGFNSRRIKIAYWITKDRFRICHKIQDYGAGNRASVAWPFMEKIEEMILVVR